MNNKALFLDRDGVINVDRGYVHTIDNFYFIDGIFELCRAAMVKLYNNSNYKSGWYGRGYYSEKDFDI